jgi:two-component system, OmpR family, response regulator QseB
MTRILIAAQGRRPSGLLEQSLRASGYMTKVARDRDSAAKLVQDEAFDLFILDLDRPEKGWDSTLRELRTADPRLPFMVLTPMNGTGEKVSELEREADECVIKPFGIEELLTRVRARLRETRPRQQRFLRAGEIALDLETRRVEVRGRPVELTDRELGLLEILMRHPDEVLSRERLLSYTWGYDYDPGSNVVAVYVGYLRSKLGQDVIETVRGAGYRLRD